MSSTGTQARSHSKMYLSYLLAALASLSIFSATSKAQQGQSVAEQVAKTYGIDSFGQIEAIRYTWNVESPRGKVSRTWEWSPKTDSVVYEGKDKEGKPVNASYRRSELSNQSDAIRKEIDPAFVNDQYWVLLPFHIVWDGAAVSNEGMNKLPVGDGSAERLVAKYPSEGGYQPGDTWDLYVGGDKRIEAIVYHRGAPNPPPRLVAATYADYKKAGPLLISTDHQGTVDGNPFRIVLSNVAVKLTGSDNWIPAQ
jgi:hypothetical protein